MPTKLPAKARAQERESNEAKYWLGLWTLSLGFCAIILAGTASLAAGDHVGAALILLGAATISRGRNDEARPGRLKGGQLLSARVKTDVGRTSNASFFQSPGFKPNTQRRDPSGRRQIVTWPLGGGTGIASSNGTSSPSIIQPFEVDDARI